MEENKLEHFLDIIHMDKTKLEELKNTFLKKVVVSRKNDYIAIYLSSKKRR